MVGVPGRSKACSTCRKRKIACSLEVPACSQCTRSGRKCSGYQKERVFITSAPSSDGYESSWKPDSYSKPLVPIRPRIEDRPSNKVSRSTNVGDHSALIKAALRQQIVGGYVSTAFSDRETQSRSWLSDIPSIPNPSRALELATFAMCTARMGRISDLPGSQLVRESLRLYGASLQATRKALSDPKLVQDDQTLGACCLLGMYEVFECPSKSRSGYLSHLEGLSKLVELRGPERHKSGTAHAIFLSFRVMGALEALMNRKTFLAQPEWSEIPFSNVEMTPFDKLLNEMLKAPVLMTLGEELAEIQSPDELLTRTKEIVRLCWDMDANLQKFFGEMEDYVGGPIYWTVPSSEATVEADAEGQHARLFPADYEFNNIRVATAMMYMWASQLILYSGFCQLYALLDVLGHGIRVMSEDPDAGPSHGAHGSYAEALGFPPLGHRSDLLEPARNICQSVEYCLQEELGVSAITGPLNIVENVLVLWPGHENVIQWAGKSLLRLRDKGVGIVNYLPRQVVDSETGRVSWS